MWKHRVSYFESIACTEVDDFHISLIALTKPMLSNDAFQLHIWSYLGTHRRLQRNQQKDDAAARNCGQNEVNNKLISVIGTQSTPTDWNKLGEVDSQCTLNNSIILAICVPKIIKYGGELTKFWQKHNRLIFGHTL